jgi:gliding motility-associated-like protein
MMRFKIIILLLITNLGFSQLSNKHWLPPLHGNQDNSTNLIEDHYIYLSTPESTPFQVTVKSGSGQAIAGSPFVISQGNPVRIEIGTAQPSLMFVDRTDVGHVISRKGLILEGQYDFYVSFRVNSSAHAEFLSSKGRTGAGTVFRLGSVPQYYDSPIRNFVSSFMATEDNTTVNLSEYDPNLIFINGAATLTTPNQTFTLNQGESVVVSGNCDYPTLSANFTGFIGALLTSDKPIVVNTGNLAGGTERVLNGGSKQDFNLDQIVSLEQVGTEYVVMKGNGSNITELPLVIAHEDNTEIFINGNIFPITTINAGEYFLIPTSNFQGTGNNLNMYITTNKPIFMYQIVAGSTNDATNGFYFIPPLNCFWQKSVDLISDISKIGNKSYTSDVIIATEAGSVVKINNVVTSSTPIAVAGNPAWESYRISNLSGDVKVESSGPLAVGVFGGSGSAGYGGYFSGFGSTPKDSETVVCSGSIVDLFDRIPGNPEPNGDWYFNGNPRVPNNGVFDPAIDFIGDYTYTFTKSCPGNPPLVITVTVTVTSIETGPYPGVSNNQNFCIEDTPKDLFNYLGTNVTTGGNWSYNGAPIINGIIDPSVDLNGNYTYTIPENGVCEAVSATIAVTINASPTLETMTSLEACDDAVDGDTNGITLFTLTDKTAEAIGTQTGITVKYYLDQNDAIANNTNNITSVRAASNTPVYVRLTNATGCFAINNFNLIVNPLPVVNAIVSLKQCDDDTDERTNFNLTEANLRISSDTTLIYSYHTSQTGATNNSNLVVNALNYNAPNNAVVWARIENTNGCFRTARVNLVVSTTQIPTTFNPAPLEECDEFVDANNLANDGFDNFDIDTAYTQLIKNVFPAGQQPFLVVSYYESYNDALLIQYPITNSTNYFSNTKTIWVRVDSTLNSDSGCQGIKELQLIVNPLPIIELGPNFTLCIDPVTGLGSEIVDATPTIAGNYLYTWTPTNPDTISGNESPQFEITQGGTYSVLVTNTDTGCTETDTIIADFSSEPEIFIAEVVTPAFSTGLTTIVCTATGGFGQYEYSLNLIDWQASNTFTDLPNGTYTAYVRDIQGCGLKIVENLFAVTYPNFFTPNGDGFNDTWGITGLDASYAAQITIYDRYGKLLKQIAPNGIGWNGMYNGQLLPATDYWFKIEYTEGGIRKEFKSHFSLKR